MYSYIPQGSLPLRFSDKRFLSFSAMRFTYPPHLIPLHSVTLTILNEDKGKVKFPCV